jgi:hypothetical protein
MAHGWDSREYAEAIVRNKQHDALRRFNDEDLVAAVKLLGQLQSADGKRTLRHEYFDSDQLPQLVLDKQSEVAAAAVAAATAAEQK